MEQNWIIAIIIIILVPLLYKWLVQRKQAINSVLQRTDEEKIKDINDALNLYGFAYDPTNDIICSHMYPWQREVGYCRFYDEVAPSLNMIIDSEPIYFEYDKRRWLIEFWKGQYGMTTGGEIGIYVTNKDDINIPGIYSGPFFEAVTDEELLNMRFELKINKKELFQRKERHWWLTGFDVGVFSSPSHLSMETRIIFPNVCMRDAFLNGLKKLGYTDNEFKVVSHMVYLNFDAPKSEQPRNHYKLVIPFIQLMNKFYCKFYNLITRDFVRTIDKIDFLRLYYPALFKIVAGNSRKKKLQNAYKEISSYLNRNEMVDNEHI